MIEVRGMFGDIDANVNIEKKNLKKCFVNTPLFNEITSKNTYLLRGFKGSGKTALLQRLSMCGKICEKCNLDLKFCKSGKFNVIYIDADDILNKFSESTMWEFAPTQSDLNAAWMNLLKVTVYEKIIIDHGSNIDKQNLMEFNKSIELQNNRFDNIVDITIEILVNALTMGGGDPQEVRNNFWNIFKNPNGKFIKVESSAKRLLQIDFGIEYYIIFDGFDHLPLTDKMAATNFVSKLTKSIMEFGYNYNYTERLENIQRVHLKLLLPEDFIMTAKIRDNSKYIGKSELLKWKKVDLKKFIVMRIYVLLKPYIKTLQSNFDEKNINYIWKKMFGNNLENQHYTIKTKSIHLRDGKYLREDVFDYIIRHTLYRARDLQIICEEIVKVVVEDKKIYNIQEFIEKLPIDPEFIRTGVNKGSRKLVRGLFEEFALMDLAGLINQFQTSKNILKYNDIYTKLEKYRGINKLEIDKKIELLYDIGFIGKFIHGDKEIKNETIVFGECKKVIDSYPSEFYMAVFSFAGNYMEKISQKDELVIAPMFYDYLNIASAADKKYLIEPVYR